MDISKLLGVLAALSVATERITEVIKTMPVLSEWFATEKKDPHREELRKLSIHLLAIAIGTILASQLPKVDGLPSDHWYYFLIYGAMVSGGSGVWNSALDIAREFNKQKQLVTDQMKTNVATGKPANAATATSTST